MVKKIVLTMILIFGFFIFNNKVFAEESSAKCRYSITGETELSVNNAVLLDIEAKNGNVVTNVNTYKSNVPAGYSYASWSATVKNIPFEAMKSNEDNSKLRCPVVYYELNRNGTTAVSFKYTLSVYKSDFSDYNNIKEMVIYDQNITEGNDNSVVESRSCAYYLDDNNSQTPDLIVNVTSNGEVLIPSGIDKKEFDDSLFKTSCPSSIYASGEKGDFNFVYTVEKHTPGVNHFYKLNYKDSNLSPNEQYTEDGNKSQIDLTEIETGEPMNCETLKDSDTYKIIRDVFTWIQIAAPIMLIIFGVLDFGKAIASSDADAMKKAQSTFVKRVIIVAAIILLPFIMDLMFSLLDGIMGNDTCGIGRPKK